MTAQVIQFRDFSAPWSPRVVNTESASIIIMPVVRIERHPDKPGSRLIDARARLRRRKLVPISDCGKD